MKYLLLLCLLVLCTLVAKGLANYYVERFNFFSALKKLLNDFVLNVNFKKEKIYTILSKQEQKQTAINNFIDMYLEFIKSDKQIDFGKIRILNDDEIILLNDIVNSVGRADAGNEKSKIENYITQIDEIYTKCKEEKEKKAPLIIKLGFLLALGLCIILI